MTRWRGWAALSVLLAMLTPMLPARAADDDFPVYTGQEWTDLVEHGLTLLPGLSPPGVPGAITGNTSLDSRIWDLAFSRGYRMRPVANRALTSVAGKALQPEAASAWKALQAEGHRQGYNLVIQSSYRSPAVQRSIFNRELNGTSNAAIINTLSYHSVPGTSLHHTGYAMDIRLTKGTIRNFESSAAFRWLSANNYRNAKRFGFVPSYPAGAPKQGPNPEPWEYTYIGVETIRCGLPSEIGTVEVLRDCPSMASLTTGDYSGDNQTDVAIFDNRKGDLDVLESVAGQFELSRWTTFTANSGWTEHLVGDFNNDGRDDIAHYRSSTGNWTVSRSTGTGFTNSTWTTFSAVSGWTQHLVGDFNGDGRDDIAHYRGSTGNWTVSRSTGTGFTNSTWTTFSAVSGWTQHLVGDFNGDGRDDIAHYRPSTGNWTVSRSTGTGFTNSTWTTFTTTTGWTEHLVGDFNGDGRDDIAHYRPSTGNWTVSRSTGTGFTNSTWTTFTTLSGWTEHLVGDYNGDGRDDIAHYRPSTGNWTVSRSTGTGFTNSTWTTFTALSGWGQHLVGDYNGDGRDDIAHYRQTTGNWTVSRSTGTSFTNSNWTD